MQFGFTLKPEHTIEATLDLARLGEDVGFDYLWLFDSHVLWRAPSALLTLIAEHTEKLRLGTCVTNPGTREPSVTASALATLDEPSGGRLDLASGPGGRSRRAAARPQGLGDLRRGVRAGGARQAADHPGPHRGGDPRHQGPRRGST